MAKKWEKYLFIIVLLLIISVIVFRKEITTLFTGNEPEQVNTSEKKKDKKDKKEKDKKDD